MFDLLVRGGTLVDGTGAAGRTADVAVTDGRIVEVGRVSGVARRTVDADGLLVTPGFVDIHTHYDGQATWDSYLSPSSLHGVTTTVFGNCGVGFAPMRPESKDHLIRLMEGVEDIPGTVLSEGVPFNWESFPEYLDVLGGRSYAMDIGALMPHGVLRFYVMGERGFDHSQRPTESEAATMARLLEESLGAGAFGLSTSRTIKHKASDGTLTPSLSADEPELHALALAMKRAGRGVFEVNSDFGPGEFEILRSFCRVSGQPMSWLIVQVDRAPGLWRETMDQIHAARAEGHDVTAQVGCRPIGMLMGLETSINPFTGHPVWENALRGLHPTKRFGAIMADPALRRALVAEVPDTADARNMARMLERATLLTEPVDLEPDIANSVAAQARRQQRNPWELALDLMLSEGGHALLLYPFENYSAGNSDVIAEMLADEASVIGVADGGAHVGLICDASAPTYLLSYWARDRTRGRRFPLEYVVRKHTLDTARVYGLTDRGVIAPGMKADLNIIDFERLALRKTEVVHDLPAGGSRLLQKARGYRHTFVSGLETLRNDEYTGELPGRLMR
ncbi:N-acyl-D-aspartate/D-glutamate deacylase [Stella humosa]|uniref:N-acyl-D-aspartate/D-glutamate deacylase n=1 Tax=Stella humosa TaxID=94 RepID=A0A3N1MA51_9PROT|nr:amidohydrolase family protein [Stella humosa]ROP99924.1 N-acyl-D-aspartate/D-glutamate deacylase [Stella humosa]BBK30846.1 amidohydrolase [Stella humosa]